VIRLLRIIGAAALVIVAFPIALMAGLFFKGRNCTPEELAIDLQKFSDGIEDAMDWDELESVPLKNPRLEAIRQEAMDVNLPLRPEDRTKLGELAARTRTLFP
jgi:hypothetical protein